MLFELRGTGREYRGGYDKTDPGPPPQPSIVVSVTSVAERSLSPRWLSLPDPVKK